MDELRGKILAVIGRVGVTDMAASIIIDLVTHAIHTAGRLDTHARRSKRRAPSSPRESDPDPDLNLFPDPRPDLSQSIEVNCKVMSAPPAVALVRGNPFTETLEAFCRLWQARYGAPYLPTPKDRNQLGRLLKDTPANRLADLPGAFRRYLEDHSPFVEQEMRHSLAFFCTQGGHNKYRVVPAIVTQGEARTLAAGDAWLAARARRAP